MLSLSQIVLFAGTLGGMMVAGALTSPPPRWRPVLAFAGWGAVVLLLARELHGFFARTVEPEGLKLEFHPFWKNSVPQFGTYLLVSLGFLMLFGSLGFLFLKRERLFLAVLGVFGLVVFALFRYPSSWDIVKFLMLVQIALAIKERCRGAVGGLAGPPAALAFPAWSRERDRLRDGLAPDRFGPRLRRLVLDQAGRAVALPADKEMIAYLRRHIRAGELVFRRDSPAGYAIQGGLPIQNADFAVNSFGFSQQLHDARTGADLRSPVQDGGGIQAPRHHLVRLRRVGWPHAEPDGRVAQGREGGPSGCPVPPLDLYHLR